MDFCAAAVCKVDVSGIGLIGLSMNSECTGRTLLDHWWLGARISIFAVTSGIITHYIHVSSTPQYRYIIYSKV